MSEPIALPRRIALCPVHGREFYYPLRDGEGSRCPEPHCTQTMAVYVQCHADARLVAELARELWNWNRQHGALPVLFENLHKLTQDDLKEIAERLLAAMCR